MGSIQRTDSSSPGTHISHGDERARKPDAEPLLGSDPFLGHDVDDDDAAAAMRPVTPVAVADAYADPRDAAADLLRKMGKPADHRVAVTPQDDERVLRRIDLFLLPLMLAVYFLQGIDKTTLAYASVFGLIEDTGLRDNQYSWLGSVVYIAQLIMQFPLAWLLVKLPIGKFTSWMVALWGATLVLMAWARDFPSLLVARFFLGAFEASVAPSFVAITQMFWRRREQPLRMSYWYAMNGFTNMFGSLITYGLANIPSSLRPYQVIFLFFGVVTVTFSFVLFAYMPDSPIEAKFLTDEDKLIAIERLRMNQTGVMSRQWRHDHLRESLWDPKTWLWFALIFCISVPSGGVSTFGPLIVQSFGFDSFTTILFNAPFGVVQLISTIGGALVAMKYHKKGPVIAVLSIAPIVGCAVLLATPHDPAHRAHLLGGYYLISVYPGIIPLIYSWSAANTAGDTKKKCTSAALFVGQSLGNIIGPLLYTPSEAPEYFRGLQSNLFLYCALVVLVAVTTAYLGHLNREHSRRRVRLGKSASIVDYSLYSAEDADRARRLAELARAQDTEAGDTGGADEGSRDRVGSRAFDDMTDLQNEEFLYVF
ncbi:hypothetical protein ACRALDRAFT_1059302 [Sodiomyces alcalophilus JCM 7366]|uniref:uncharacterized protein n=1 Tax=Sodiomyces alcalophilus JCM 7366 TaxID=591952 RepID=UPI0039B40916